MFFYRPQKGLNKATFISSFQKASSSDIMLGLLFLLIRGGIERGGGSSGGGSGSLGGGEEGGGGYFLYCTSELTLSLFKVVYIFNINVD